MILFIREPTRYMQNKMLIGKVDLSFVDSSLFCAGERENMMYFYSVAELDEINIVKILKL